MRGGTGAGQWWPRTAGRVLSRLARHSRAPGHRLRHPLRVRHLRPGDPRRMAGREDRQLVGQREPLGDSEARCELSGQLGRFCRALRRRRRPRARALGARTGDQGGRLRHADPGVRREYVQRVDVVERAGRRVVRPRRLQHRRLLQGGRGRGQLGDRHQGALPERRARRRQAAAPVAAVLLRVLLAAARRAHHGRSGRPFGARAAPAIRVAAQRHPPVYRGCRAHAAAGRRTTARLGRGLEHHGGHVRLHKPHLAPGSAGDVAAGDVRRIVAPPSRDHLRDQPPLPRRGARAVPWR